MLVSRTRTSIQDACDALLEADRLTAEAIAIIGRVDADASTGLPTEMMLALGARRTGADARMLVRAAATLRGMPATTSAFARGDLSWSQVRQIVGSVRSVDAPGRARIDGLISSEAERLQRMDPDELLGRVDEAVATVRADLARARESRQIDKGSLSIQGRVDGSATFYGEADAESTATVLAALDAVADRPVAPDQEGPSRPQQRLAALVGICEQVLAGTTAPTARPRPRLIATIDIASLRRDGDRAGTRLLWSLAGRPAHLTPLSTEVLACDASVVPVVFDGARPVAVGDAAAPISSKLRAALVARDGGCRFPGCGAPVAWCDAHHIRARIHDGPTVIDNLVLLCRRCHRSVHRHRWRISVRDDGVMEFTRRSETYASSRRAMRRE